MFDVILIDYKPDEWDENELKMKLQFIFIKVSSLNVYNKLLKGDFFFVISQDDGLKIFFIYLYKCHY